MPNSIDTLGVSQRDYGIKMKAAVIILMLLIAMLLLLGIIALVVLWFGGSKVIVLPGLGILITTPLLLAVFVALEVVVLLSASLLWRLSW